MRPLQQLTHLLIKLTETHYELSIVLCADQVQSPLQRSHKPLYVSLHLLSFPKTEQLKEWNCQAFKDIFFRGLIQTLLVFRHDFTVNTGYHRLNSFLLLTPRQMLTNKGFFLNQSPGTPLNVVNLTTIFPCLCGLSGKLLLD